MDRNCSNCTHYVAKYAQCTFIPPATLLPAFGVDKHHQLDWVDVDENDICSLHRFEQEKTRDM